MKHKRTDDGGLPKPRGYLKHGMQYYSCPACGRSCSGWRSFVAHFTRMAFVERNQQGDIRTLEHLNAARDQRRSVHCPKWRNFAKPRPAAFMMHLPGDVLLRLFRAGMFVYKKGAHVRKSKIVVAMRGRYGILKAR